MKGRLYNLAASIGGILAIVVGSGAGQKWRSDARMKRDIELVDDPIARLSSLV